MDSFGTGAKAIMVIFGILVMGALIGGCAGCTRIEAGHVGIIINYAGDNRGVGEIPTTTGWTFFNPITQTVFEYPTYVQTAVWTRNVEEGSPTNEEISFNSKDGLNITADVSFSYQLGDKYIPHFYVKFRSDDLGKFTHGFLRNIARDHFVGEGGRYTAEEIYATKTEEFVRKVRELVNKDLADIGVTIEQFGFIGAPRPPASIIEAINNKVAATQNAMRVENELRQAKAAAQKAVADAEGKAQSQVAAARGEAESNRILVQSITPQLIEWRKLSIQEQWISRWNGQRPQVEGAPGTGMMFQVTPK